MKIKFLSIVFISMIISSCTKDESCTPQAVSAEKNDMIAYCTANGINYTQDPSGILYEIVNPGTGTQPTATSKVYIYYTGKLLNGTIFDQLSDPTKSGWYLSNLIEGWRIAIPLIKKGGRIKMVIPSALAYGCKGSGSIQPNTPLYFDVTVTEVL